MTQIRVLGICGNLRTAFTNFGLLRFAREHAPAELEIKIAALANVPFYNADLMQKPAAVQTLLADQEQAYALLLA